MDENAIFRHFEEANFDEEANFYVLGCANAELEAIVSEHLGPILSDHELASFRDEMLEEEDACSEAFASSKGLPVSEVWKFSEENKLPLGPLSKRFEKSWFLRHQLDQGRGPVGDADPDYAQAYFSYGSHDVERALRAWGASYVLVSRGGNSDVDWSKIVVFGGAKTSFDLVVTDQICWVLDGEEFAFEWGPVPREIQKRWQAEVARLGDVGARIGATVDITAWFADPR